MGLKEILDQHHQRGAYTPSTGAPVVDIADEFWRYLSSLSDVKDERRVPGYHPSQLYDFCPRKEILDLWFPQKYADSVEPGLQMIFDWGTAWHWMVQNHYFGPMGILYGAWKCNGCAKVVRDCFMPDPCERCHGKREWKPPRRGGYWTYLEPRVFQKEWNIPGHGDGILILNRQLDGPKSLLEIKTINGYSWERLRGPEEHHVFQMNVYLWLLEFKEAWITYWTKDAKQQKPKVFCVRFDPNIVEQVKWRIDTHRLAAPEKKLCEGLCKTDQDKHAIKCSQRTNCFRPDIDKLIEAMKAKANGN